MKKILLPFLFLTLSFFTFAQTKKSKMPHLDQIVSFFDNSEQESFYSIGRDGFINKWNSDETGDHFQITNQKIIKFALHPDNNEFAIYETNDENFYSISVWNIKDLSKKFSIELTDSVLSLSYSKKGTYLIVGTTTEQGTLFINSKSGKIERPIKDSMNMIAYSESSNSEKNLLSYSITGTIYYHNLQNGTLVKKIKTENDLSNILTCNKNKYLVGIKDSIIFIIDAMSGKTVYEQNASSLILFSYKDELYYLSQPINKKASIFKFDLTTEKISSPKIYKNITLKKAELFSDVTILNEKILFGTTTGNIYTATNQKDTSEELYQITDNSILNINDISYVNNDLYILTNSSLYKTTEDKSNIIKICNANNYTKLTTFKDKLILWSQGNDAQVSMLDEKSNKLKNLFVAKGYLSHLKSCYNNLITIQSASIVNKYNFETNTLSEIYYGSGIQDAVVISDNNLYIAKSKINQTDSSLIFVNTKTKETVPLKINCDFIYALAVEQKNIESDNIKKEVIYGIGVNNKNNNAETVVLKFDIEKQDSKIIKKYNNIDFNSFLQVYNNVIFTDVLSAQFFAITNSKEFVYNRSSSFPKKITMNDENIVVLNQDASLSWYQFSNNKIIEDWYIMNDESIEKY